ncbi:MAG TPA: 6-bladed beta-propeller [Prolixibacteraceae bacterium]|jgi:hypothetical protein
MKYFELLIILFIVMGCQKKPLTHIDKNVEIINLNEGLENDGIVLKLSDIAKYIQYVPLETTNECLIDKIDKIMIDDSLIFLFNKKQFFIFNKTGKFVRSVGRVGKGPGEYLRIMDFTINSTENIIYIYDSDQKKVLKFNFNGDFDFEFKLSSYPTCITCVDDKFLALSWVKPDFIGNENYGLSYYTLDGQLLSKSFDRENEKAKESMASTFLTRLNYYCDSLTYWEINLDIIYRIIEETKMIPRYKIDYTTNIASKEMNKISKDIFRYSDFIETDKYLFFLRGVFRNKIKHLIYNKETKECRSFSFKHNNNLNFELKAGFINDLDGGFPFLPFDALRDGRIYNIFYPYELKSLIKQDIYDGFTILEKKKQEDLYSKINKSKVMDNPIIMIVTLK